MQNAKGIVIGFAAGLAVAAGAVLLFRDQPAVLASDSARIAELSAQIERLERSVSRQTMSAGGSHAATTQAGTEAASTPSEPESVPFRAEQQKVIASAEAFVDQAIQTGQWTRLQARELSEMTSDLPAEEQGRILARISQAINNDQIQPELP
jgi:hypothetical protein